MKNSLKKLELNKRTIANLNATEMNEQIGGANLGRTKGHCYYTFALNCTRACGW